MQHLLTLPPALVDIFKDIYQIDKPEEWFCDSDPVDRKLGSGGGTAALLRSWRKQLPDRDAGACRKIIMHAGGQSRRLPAYAPVGKILTPIPVFRWARGQRLGQTLLDLQMPLYEEILESAPSGLTTLIASGDVYVRAPKGVGEIPDADVVCFGLWTDASQATRHGVFASRRDTPDRLDMMLQKPSLEQLQTLSNTHLFLMDVGIWLLSEKALRLLEERSTMADGEIGFYDMYTDFGGGLGINPLVKDDAVNSLKVAIIVLEDGEFYHYGTSGELVSSTVRVQNLVHDQRKIMHRKIKPDASIFTANSLVETTFSTHNRNIWVENSHVGKGWTLTRCNIITGIPENDWKITVPEGICIDIIPLKTGGMVVRPYGYNDTNRGAMDDPTTLWMSRSVTEMALGVEGDDIFSAPLLPIVENMDEARRMLDFLIFHDESCRKAWEEAEKISQERIADLADIKQIYESRRKYARLNWQQLSNNWERSVFYQLDLADAAKEYVGNDLPVPSKLPDEAPTMERIHNRMLAAECHRRRGEMAQFHTAEGEAFEVLRDGLLSQLKEEESKPSPRLSAYTDQIIWARSPVRIDLAGGWTDTPPYPLLSGGTVVNMAVELNGQPPLQAYVKPCRELHIVLRSIDLGASELITTYDELQQFNKVGSPFSIPKAAITLAGFSDLFGHEGPKTLRERLEKFGCGFEVTLLSAVPAGSGLGTSSILAATVLGALSEFCGLGWDRNEICRRTMALEQLLTTGGGWQDQYGGVLPGAKLLQTSPGMRQQPEVDWLPERLFQLPEYRDCHLLYYTGITRTAKDILAEIVRGMFLNSGHHLRLLNEMRQHAQEMASCIRKCDFELYTRLLAKTWQQNQMLDSGTNPPAVRSIIESVSPWLAACKLPGAGGGGFIYMVGKDSEATAAIKRRLMSNPPNNRARFVDMSISANGLQVSRS